MRIINGTVYCQYGTFRKTDLLFDEHILQIGSLPEPSPGEECIDASGKYVIPGLIDIHSHGAMGADASDGDIEGLRTLSRYYAARGVTSWCPTTMSLPEETLTHALLTIRAFAEEQEAQEGIGQRSAGAGDAYRSENHSNVKTNGHSTESADPLACAHRAQKPDSATASGARCVGVHLEGPFLNPKKCGAQAPQSIRRPDFEELCRLNEASGSRIRIVTAAPEMDEDFSFIRRASKLCTVSIGHSAADYDTAHRAFSAGASHVTHLFNGMTPLHHRDPGILGAAFDAHATVECICDGLHLHPSAVRLARRLFFGNMALVSDSMRCAGMPDGIYTLGGQNVIVKNRRAALADGTLAGSSVHLMDTLYNLLAFGTPLGDAVAAATCVPAKIIGMQHEIGTIAVGFKADLVILSDRLIPETVIIGGKRFEAD